MEGIKEVKKEKEKKMAELNQWKTCRGAMHG